MPPSRVRTAAAACTGRHALHPTIASPSTPPVPGRDRSGVDLARDVARTGSLVGRSRRPTHGAATRPSPGRRLPRSASRATRGDPAGSRHVARRTAAAACSALPPRARAAPCTPTAGRSPGRSSAPDTRRRRHARPRLTAAWCAIPQRKRHVGEVRAHLGTGDLDRESVDVVVLGLHVHARVDRRAGQRPLPIARRAQQPARRTRFTPIRT